MKVIIPVKSYSSRLENKNWRPFFEGKSLTEIKIEQLLKVFKPEDLVMSCDSEEKFSVAEQYGIGFHHRDFHLTLDETNWSDVVTELIGSLPADSDEAIMWAEVTDPIFDNYRGMVEKWEAVNKDYDSITVVKTFSSYLLDSEGRGVNFNPGYWHKRSQVLPVYYTMQSSFIIRKKTAIDARYVIGRKPYLFTTEQSHEIDNLADFEFAQHLYRKSNENKK